MGGNRVILVTCTVGPDMLRHEVVRAVPCTRDRDGDAQVSAVLIFRVPSLVWVKCSNVRVKRRLVVHTDGAELHRSEPPHAQTQPLPWKGAWDLPVGFPASKISNSSQTSFANINRGHCCYPRKRQRALSAALGRVCEDHEDEAPGRAEGVPADGTKSRTRGHCFWSKKSLVGSSVVPKLALLPQEASFTSNTFVLVLLIRDDCADASPRNNGSSTLRPSPRFSKYVVDQPPSGMGELDVMTTLAPGLPKLIQYNWLR